MKKIIPIAIFSFFALVLQVQAQFLIGGNIGFSAKTFTDENAGVKEESKTTSISVIPRLGFAFGNNWAGIDVGLTSQKSESPDGIGGTAEKKLNLVSIAPFYRYINMPTENMGIWLEAQAAVTFGKDQLDGKDQTKYSMFGVGIRPGVIFYIGDHLSFEASFGRLGFSQATATDAVNTDLKETNSDFGLSLNNNAFGIGTLGDNIIITPNFLFGVNWMFGGDESADK